MKLFGKTALVLGMAGAMALGSMTVSEARSSHRGAFVAGAAGFAAGAAVGAAAANSNYYNGGYGYAEPGYNAYGSYDGPASAYTGDPSYYNGGYGYYGYNSNSVGPMRERVLEGHDY